MLASRIHNHAWPSKYFCHGGQQHRICGYALHQNRKLRPSKRARRSETGEAVLRSMISLGCPSPREQSRHRLRTTISGDRIIHCHVKAVLAWRLGLFAQRVHLIGSL